MRDGRDASTAGSVVPLITVCLLALGAILLIQQLWLDVDWLVGAAVALLQAITWAATLYVGTLITLLYIPALALIAFAFLVIAGRHAAAGHGWGWQLWLGGALLLLFGLTVVNPAEGWVVVPVVLIALGAALAEGMAPVPEPERRADGGY